MIRIVKANTSLLEVKAALDWLQATCFCETEQLSTDLGYWWIARNGDVPVAFAALQVVPSWDNTAYMARSGVIHSYRGQGIQKLLLKKREQFAKQKGFERIITTTYNNPASSNSLIARGFKTYLPESKWGAADTIYWLKTL